MRRVCVFGAGGIGGYLAVRLAAAAGFEGVAIELQVEVPVIAAGLLLDFTLADHRFSTVPRPLSPSAAASPQLAPSGSKNSGHALSKANPAFTYSAIDQQPA